MAPKETPPNNLWVSNLSPDIRDDDITSLFQIFGPLDSVTTYLSREFGFVKFRNINDSKEAKDALQGYFFHGNPLRIEFAKLIPTLVIMDHWKNDPRDRGETLANAEGELARPWQMRRPPCACAGLADQALQMWPRWLANAKAKSWLHQLMHIN
ncbi:uncharacterized protein LOC129899965 [Solanum dulcamara]|uniref:uncharacterized protein LOC129899965 n=1 Tax=Solanum dulcamara TaxID=45834 RepID=UPI002485FAA3|nr:uncharacterized protein LOC129899965 [Solanum dulcamara]